MKPAAFKLDDGRTFRVGDKVSLDVTWKDGRTSHVSGTLITISDGEAFVESSFGAVAGDVATLTGDQ